MNTKIKIFYSEAGFTLIEVSIAFLILSLVSVPIFYNCFQALNNIILAQKYYNTTLDVQNILVNVKSHLDKNHDVNETDLKNLLDSLNLNIKDFKYELYFYDFETNLILNYYYPSAKENYKPKINFEATNFIYDSSLNDLIELDNLIINNKNSQIDSTFNLSKQPLSIDIKNYKPENIEINIYSDETAKYINNLKLQSLQEGESIRVNYYNQYPIKINNYIILVLIKDFENKILNQIFDIYSSVI